MPTMEGYEYAEKPHKKTSIDANYKYGCNSQRTGDHGARQARTEPTSTHVQDGWTEDGRRKMVEIAVAPRNECKHDEKEQDSYCTGCEMRRPRP